MPIGSNILAGASGQAAGYDIDQSLRFDDGDYLSKTPSSAGNRKTWTLSFWAKRSVSTVDYQNVIMAGTLSSTSNRTLVRFNSSADDGKLKIQNDGGFELTSDAVFRDPSAWYHVLVVVDTTDATAGDRVKLWVNGDSQTLTGTNSALNEDTSVNNTLPHYIGRSTYTTGRNFDGYLAEVHFIDGQALTPASFGETDSDTNQWVPIEYAGSYGTNGFYLKFQDSAALGDDSSGNTNDFSATNLVATDQVLDSPTNNFATLNPLAKSMTSNLWTWAEGNLKASGSASTTGNNLATIGVSSGKWYWEVLYPSPSGTPMKWQAGVYLVTSTGSNDKACYVRPGATTPNITIDSGFPSSDSSQSGSLATFSGGDILGIALDLDGSSLQFYHNGSTYGTAISLNSTDVEFTAGIGDYSTTGNADPVFYLNFGQDSSFAGSKTAQGNTDGNGKGDFYYSPPSGYLALCSDNLSDPSIADPTVHFNSLAFTGTGSTTKNVTGVGFQPDLVWLKTRVNAASHALFDSVRGTNKVINSNTTNAEASDSGAGFSAFDSDGFTVIEQVSAAGTINDSAGMISWNWKAGGTAVSNTDGTITSSVSANTDAGFSIVSYTGNGTNGATVGHGLSQNPNLAIVKKRESNGADGVRSWIVSGDEVSNWTYLLSLNQTAASWANAAISSPTSSTLTLSTEQAANYSGDTYIMYCFHSVDGYSKVGSYTGNGNADGTFIYTGFRPAFVIYKSIGVQSWYMLDSGRSSYNVADDYLEANNSNQEYSGAAQTDFVSNGLKIRTSAGGINNSSVTFIYLAFAESPFKTSNAR